MGWLRHPKTTQEINRNFREEEKKFVRGKRSSKRLPNSWDDYVGQTTDRSWKRHRKTKWKLVD